MENKPFFGRWQKEISYVTRYAGSGAINSIAGFAAIFSAMAAGFSPLVSNFAGYAVGFFLGFVLSKNFVFRSHGKVVAESLRYVVAFLVSFIFNLIILQLSIEKFVLNPVLAQIIAATGYTFLMYILARFYVFQTKA